ASPGTLSPSTASCPTPGGRGLTVALEGMVVMRNAAHARGSQAIDGYHLLEKLGEGGMGTVYKARRRDSEDLVAVKILSPDKQTAGSILKRFEQEFRAAQRLDHPNIVKVRDFGCTGEDTYYMVMELVEGTSLGKRTRKQGRLPEVEAISIIQQTAA